MTTFPFANLKSEKNVRTAYGDLKILADSLEKDGQQDPLLIHEDGTIIRGHRRWAAMKLSRAAAETRGEKLPFEEVDVIIRAAPKNEIDRLKLQLLDQDGVRKNLTNWEIARAFSELKQEGLLVSEIATTAGLSEQHTAKLVMAVEEASPDVKKLLDKGAEVTVAFLYSLPKIPKEEQKTELQALWQEKTRPPKKVQVGAESEKVRTGKTHLRRLLQDLQAAGPKWKPAVTVLRYLTGETESRPVPKTGNLATFKKRMRWE